MATRRLNKRGKKKGGFWPFTRRGRIAPSNAPTTPRRQWRNWLPFGRRNRVAPAPMEARAEAAVEDGEMTAEEVERQADMAHARYLRLKEEEQVLGRELQKIFEEQERITQMLIGSHKPVNVNAEFARLRLPLYGDSVNVNAEFVKLRLPLDDTPVQSVGGRRTRRAIRKRGGRKRRTLRGGWWPKCLGGEGCMGRSTAAIAPEPIAPTPAQDTRMADAVQYVYRIHMKIMEREVKLAKFERDLLEKKNALRLIPNTPKNRSKLLTLSNEINTMQDMKELTNAAQREEKKMQNTVWIALKLRYPIDVLRTQLRIARQEARTTAGELPEDAAVAMTTAAELPDAPAMTTVGELPEDATVAMTTAGELPEEAAAGELHALSE